MISKRLKKIASFVSENSNVLDVGCDHALLDIYLVKNKNATCIASDINEKPLQAALKNIKLYNLEDKIKVSLADGVEYITDDIDTVVISGLGSNTIIDIINKDFDKLKNVKHFIISSNNDYYYLRKCMNDLGFIINMEEMIYDKKYYLIIDFVYGSKKYNYIDLKYGPILRDSEDKVYKDYLMNLKNKKINILKSLGFRHLFKKFSIKKEIREIDRIL